MIGDFAEQRVEQLAMSRVGLVDAAQMQPEIAPGDRLHDLFAGKLAEVALAPSARVAGIARHGVDMDPIARRRVDHADQGGVGNERAQMRPVTHGQWTAAKLRGILRAPFEQAGGHEHFPGARTDMAG